jgi:glycosyltransferase involved in cell wall biosynthesis
MESNRNWKPDWGNLDVRVQRTWTMHRIWRHGAGFSDRIEVHFPWDTPLQLRRLKPDVVVSAELGCRSLLAALHAGRRGPALVLRTHISEHTEQGRGWARHVLRKWLIRQADCITVNSASGARYLRRMGCNPAKIVRVPYAPEPSTLYEGPAARDPECAHRLLYVGQLIPRKGIQPFLDALTAWAEARPSNQAELVVAGSGPLQAQLQARRQPPNLAIRWLGECSFQQVKVCYSDAGIFVFPSLADEWGMVVNEAMYAGLPVLGSRYGQAVEELCIDGETGWMFRPDCPAEIEAALDRAFAATHAELNAMRARARKRVARITPQYAAEQLLEAIRLALHRKAIRRHR